MSRFALRTIHIFNLSQLYARAIPARLNTSLYCASFHTSPVSSYGISPKSNLVSMQVKNISLITRSISKASNVELSPDKVVSNEDMLNVMNDNEVYLIDVRTNKEIVELGKIASQRWVNIPYEEVESAFNMSETEFESKYGSVKPEKDTKIVFHCMGGVRSTVALNAAHNLGFTKSRHFPGGFRGWEALNRN
uniref:thiosulfate sulfurtransferase/rhodanese-like domain-containing protein 3 n=1 Tax=Ciona intestinalis TaxID=7719 RepID=UPI0000523CA2|nr:thiosulfate sulfurtransferase/rhodanese-like domain-containing protein 3 [Ciona intestinalis]|eukprot:XP_002121990.1 thiosulfate sulfurtransferase/rhodanese-like domain-containing protein 3 [Ciona intestinalis]